MNFLERAAIMLLCVPFLTGCVEHKAPSVAEQTAPDTSTVQEVEALSGQAGRLTVWSAYWDCADDMELLRDEADKVDEISLFAAYFQEGELVIPEATTRLLNKIRRKESTKEKTVYLSVVNDVQKNGKTTQKDTDILKQVLGTESAAQEHAEQLVRLAADNGYDGIELDYEKIRKDMELWADFLRFEEKLLGLAEENGLKVRIVLEPGTPVEQLDFPEGADYVVMCYNLHGGGTDPGAKADNSFLESLVEKFGALPNVSYALANGGYCWEGESQTAVQCRAAEAAAMAEQAGVTPERDPDSGALFFSYTEKGKRYTVWYADETTLVQWAQQLNALTGGRVDISLWRI